MRDCYTHQPAIFVREIGLLTIGLKICLLLCNCTGCNPGSTLNEREAALFVSLVCISVPLNAATTRGDRAEYAGGSVALPKRTQGSIDTADTQILHFVYEGGMFDLPYQRIKRMECGDRAGVNVDSHKAMMTLGITALPALFSKKHSLVCDFQSSRLFPTSVVSAKLRGKPVVGCGRSHRLFNPAPPEAWLTWNFSRGWHAGSDCIRNFKANFSDLNSCAGGPNEPTTGNAEGYRHRKRQGTATGDAATTARGSVHNGAGDVCVQPPGRAGLILRASGGNYPRHHALGTRLLHGDHRQAWTGTMDRRIRG